MFLLRIVLEQFDLLNNIYGGARAKIPRSIDTFALFQVEFQVLNSQILNKVMLMKLLSQCKPYHNPSIHRPMFPLCRWFNYNNI